jgi:uncharacterized protein (TIGR03000 family)
MGRLAGIVLTGSLVAVATVAFCGDAQSCGRRRHCGCSYAPPCYYYVPCDYAPSVGSQGSASGSGVANFGGGDGGGETGDTAPPITSEEQKEFQDLIKKVPEDVKKDLMEVWNDKDVDAKTKREMLKKLKKKPDEDEEVKAPAPATLVVTLPADARLTCDDAPTALGGERRVFLSPPLAFGADYHYTLRAQFVQDGRQVTRVQQVTVRAGEEASVSFRDSPPVRVARGN